VLVKKFSTIYGTKVYIIAFAGTHHSKPAEFTPHLVILFR